MIRLPPFFPRPPFLQEEDEEKDEEEDKEEIDWDFRRKMKLEGFDPNLIEMGIKVADNHSRTREEALKIGQNYIKEMSK